jgi:hypothetical protein
VRPWDGFVPPVDGPTCVPDKHRENFPKIPHSPNLAQEARGMLNSTPWKCDTTPMIHP